MVSRSAGPRNLEGRLVLVLLPPSETKRDGGIEGSSLVQSELGFPELRAQRRSAISATRALSRNRAAASVALKLGATQGFEILRNRVVTSSPVMPALDRYTGVLYDALDAAALCEEARCFAESTVVIHSALFGLVRADDLIPAYRLSHDSKLTELRLGALWREGISAVLGAHDGLILDLRSEAYVALGPVPAGSNSFFLRVVTEAPDGSKRALNHFNKKGKGTFVRSLVSAAIVHDDVGSLVRWAESEGVRLRAGAPGELELVLDSLTAAR